MVTLLLVRVSKLLLGFLLLLDAYVWWDEVASQVLMKRPMSLTHLKVLLGCLLEEYNKEGGENHQAQKSYSEEL